MANIYSGILRSMVDIFASVISNNLNDVMKVLSIITIVMSIPTIVFSAYGMNLNASGMPFSATQWGFFNCYSDIHSSQDHCSLCAVKKEIFLMKFCNEKGEEKII